MRACVSTPAWDSRSKQIKDPVCDRTVFPKCREAERAEQRDKSQKAVLDGTGCASSACVQLGHRIRSYVGRLKPILIQIEAPEGSTAVQRR